MHIVGGKLLLMGITVIIEKHTCKWWQVRRKQKQLGLTYKQLGYYNSKWDESGMISAHIRYIDVWPLGKWVLEHELGHHVVASRCSSRPEAIAMSEDYDKRTCSGLLQFRAKV